MPSELPLTLDGSSVSNSPSAAVDQSAQGVRHQDRSYLTPNPTESNSVMRRSILSASRAMVPLNQPEITKGELRARITTVRTGLGVTFSPVEER